MYTTEDLYQKILNKVVLFLSYRPRTWQEAKERLSKYLESEKALDNSVKEQIINKILEYLDQNKLVNDEEFAKAFIESKCRGKSALGRQAILAKLMQKGISKSDAVALIDSILSPQDELKVAVKTLKNKYNVTGLVGEDAINNLSEARELQLHQDKTIRAKMTKYLLTKGFTYDLAKDAVDYLLKHP